MDLDLSTILVFATGALTGIVAALKIIAPRTKTTVDDKILSGAEKVLDVLPTPKQERNEPKQPVALPPRTRDHR